MIRATNSSSPISPTVMPPTFTPSASDTVPGIPCSCRPFWSTRDTDHDPGDTLTTSPARHAALVATAVAVPVAVVVGIVVTVLRCGTTPAPAASGTPTPRATGPVRVTAPPAGSAATRVCPGLIGALPATLDGHRSRPVTGARHSAAAWGDPPIVLRCGVGAPSAAAGGQLLTLDGLTWRTSTTDRAVVWTTTDRSVPIEISVPATYTGQGPLVSGLSRVIVRTDHPR